MIILQQNAPGFITIDSSQEPKFASSGDSLELTSFLFIKEFDRNRIIAEDVGKPGEVLEYICNWLSSKGYQFSIDNYLKTSIKHYKQEKSLIDLIRKRKYKIEPFSTGESYGIKRRLLKHQREAVKHALSIQHAANFSVPGSGKTTIALSVYAVLHQQKVVDRLFVIGPASSFLPWQEEFKLTFGYQPKVIRLIGTRQKRYQLLRYLEGVDIILCTYQMAHREKDNLSRLLQVSKCMFILDESHHIKNIDLGPWAQTAIELSPLAQRRMILTGTPAPHSLKDLWTQFTFLWPSQVLLGNRNQFEQDHLNSGDSVNKLKRILSPFFKRTKKSDLNLPEPISHFEKIPSAKIPNRQRLIIRLLELKTLQEAKTVGLGKTDIEILRKWRRARAIRLLQAASNPSLLSASMPEFGTNGEPLDDDPALASLLKDYHNHEIPAKISYVIDNVKRLLSEGRKVIVWATFIENLLLLKKLLKDYSPLLIYGGIPAYEEDTDPDFENRERNIKEFKASQTYNVLLANPAACAESISLHTVCSHAIYLERTFNCGQFLQSMDRIHRVGMNPRVHPHYYIPLLACAIEKVVDRRLRARQRVLYTLLNDDMPVVGFDDESFLVEKDEDLEVIFQEILREITKNATKKGN